MAKTDVLTISQEKLAEAWREKLPSIMRNSERCEVYKDEGDAKALRITIHVAGHQMYELDFKVAYMDSREVLVELVDVERDHDTVDERSDIIQELVHDYKRHLHECAQALHALTHS